MTAAGFTATSISVHGGNTTVAGFPAGAGIGHGRSTQSSFNAIDITEDSVYILGGIVGVDAKDLDSGPGLSLDWNLKAVSVAFRNGSFTAVRVPQILAIPIQCHSQVHHRHMRSIVDHQLKRSSLDL
jgi:hypothetical protein